jgi:ribose-phosphate pyrophosphokinase
MRFDRIKILAGNSNLALAEEICGQLDVPLARTSVKTFADGETWIQVHENVRGSDVFVIQSTCSPVNHHLMELLLIIDALKRASADRITAVFPYFGYARQDRKDQPRVPISARLVANLIERAGADRVLALDLHAAQIQGFFDIQVDHLFVTPVMLDHFKAFPIEDLTVVSPDAGGVERARAFAKRLQAPLAIIDKRRDQPNVAEVMNIVGDVQGRNCLVVDDLIDTAGTLTKAADALASQGAASVRACATHGVLSGPALDRIMASPTLQEVIITNSIPLSPAAAQCGKIRVLSVAKLLARAIDSIHGETSISVLFE